MAYDRWQYCQVEVGANNNGVLRQFFTDRTPVEMQLYQNWPAMLAKLGEQGWELVSAVPGGIGKSSMVYVFKRLMSGGVVATVPAPGAQTSSPPQPTYGTDARSKEDDRGFEPLRGL